MDVSQPNNWPRIEELCQLKGWGLDELGYGVVDDQQTAVTLKQMYADGYLCEPHGAIAYNVLEQQLAEGETGLFLCTAHPAKFKDVVDDILGTDLPLPAPLAKHNALPLLSLDAANDFAAIKAVLYSVQPLL